jgi:hypothetical protein
MKSTDTPKSFDIGKPELMRYLQEESGFHFELNVLWMLRSLHISCSHGGHYIDEVTQKVRQYDIQAEVAWPYNDSSRGRLSVRLAIECKKLTSKFPLLVSCVDRQADESSLHAVLGPTSMNGMFLPPELLVRHNCELYGDRLCGKELNQIGWKKSGNGWDLTSSDGDVFGKWTQAVSSAQGLIADARRTPHTITAILPVLVVPDKTLWQVEYDSDGSMKEPMLTQRCTYFLGQQVHLAGLGPFTISNLEIMTFSGLRDFVRDRLRHKQALGKFFPSPPIERDGFI